MRGTARGLGALLLAALVACGSGEAGPPIGVAASAIAIPPIIGGLETGLERGASKEYNKQIERLSKLTTGVRPYVADGVAYSLREGKELKAVLQISRLTADASPVDPDFRRSIVDQIGRGSTSPFCGRKLTVPPCAVGEQLVFAREGTQQVFYVWFGAHHLFVLMVRIDDRSGEPVDATVVLADALGIRSI